MQILLDYNLEELNELFLSMGEKSYRAEQVFTALYKGQDFSEMTSLSKELREKFSTTFIAKPVEIVKSLKSVDGTEKFLFKLSDGNVIESVLMNYKYGKTLCVSTQVGCRMGCAFCASGIDGLIRNLTAGEILGQIIEANRYVDGGLGDKRKIINVVLMGSGEPLDNYDNVVKFIKNISIKQGLNLSPRNISLSTCGIVPKIYTLAEENLPVNLTISLHSPFDQERQKIMPIAKAYSLKELLQA
ncbi:MAG: radical SAM protein, partial [Clostridia bacterium]|nr:radical SAM protein [Clostridia bacterium]